MDVPDGVEEARQAVQRAERIVVLTGAGISTDSGIPDYRGPNGVWTKNPRAERMADISHYMADAEVRRASWRNRIGSPIWESRPNAGHLALVELERQGRLHSLLTQNIDGLHQEAGSDPALVVELHGTVRDVVCMGCGDRNPMDVALERVRAGDDDPHCLRCGGILKSATISFGQSLDMGDLARAEKATMACDLLLAVGSSLTVTPAADVVPLAKRRGATVVIVNGDETAYDSLADVVVRGPISEILPRIVQP